MYDDALRLHHTKTNNVGYNIIAKRIVIFLSSRHPIQYVGKEELYGKTKKSMA